MTSIAELLWRVAPGVRRAERGRFLFFFTLAALLSLSGTLGLAGSEALFLAQLGPGRLPAAFILASITSVVGSVGYAVIVGRVRNDRFFIVLLGLTAFALAILAALLMAGATTPALLAIFCLFYLAEAVLVSLHFWTFATDFFDTLSSKRLFPLFAVGSSVGGVLGGGLAAGLSAVLPGVALIIAWAIGLVLVAIQLRLGRSRLLRWAPVGEAEADESSVEGLQGAIRYIKRSPMAYWAVISMVGMVFSLTLMQYLYLDIFSRAYPSAEELAAFFGIYLAVSNAIEILVAKIVTPWVIHRFGIAQANLVHSGLTLLAFVGLALDPRLYVAVLARATDELLDNSLAGPIRALIYNALPYRFRGRMRALLEGVVFYGSMSLAGATLMLLDGRVDLRLLACLGGAVGLIYAFANLRLRREYLQSLVDELRRGRLDLGEMAGELPSRELGGLAQLWETTLDMERDHCPPAVLPLTRVLAARGFAEPVRRHANHPVARARLACLEALAECDDPELSELLTRALVDPEPEVRRLAARLVGGLSEPSAELWTLAEQRLSDEDAEVRAQTAANLREAGLPILERMLSDDDSDAVVAALQLVPAELWGAVEPLARDESPRIRASAIDALTRLDAREALTRADLVLDLHHANAEVRRAAAAGLATRADDDAIGALAGALDDVSRSVRQEAQDALASLGEAGVLAAAPLARGTRVWTVDAALTAIERAGGPVAQAFLKQAYRDRVAEAWYTKLALEILETHEDLGSRFLHAAMENNHRRARIIAFRLLELLEEPAVVRSVSRALDREDSRTRGDALEVLSNLADREASQRLTLLLEEGPVADKLPLLADFMVPPADVDEVLLHAGRSTDRWLELAASRYQGGVDSAPQEKQTMERLLALRSIPLFAHLSLEQLETINQLLQEADFLAGETICREGEPGQELFLLLEGEVEFFKNMGTRAEENLGTFTPVSYFGEIAILDERARSATVVAKQDSHLLSLAGARFKELILQAPEISFEIFPILIGRIRAAESRLATLKEGSS